MQQQSTTSTPVVCPRGTSAYTWQEGDTLESVARDRGITAQSMTLANPDTDFNTLAAGSTVCIPPRIFSCLSGELYQVKAGDTIEIQFGGGKNVKVEVLEVKDTVRKEDAENLYKYL